MEGPPNGNGCLGCSGLLMIVAAYGLITGISETMRGTPLTSEVSWQSAQGGELLTTGERAAPGQQIKPAGHNVALGDNLVNLIVGSVAALLGIAALIIGIGERRAWKRKQRGEE